MSELPVQQRSRSRAFAAGLLGLATLLLAVHVGQRILGLPITGTGAYVEELAYDGIFFLAAAACLLRAQHAGPERWAWRFIGLGLLANAAGYLYYSLHWMLGTDVPPFPSASDVCWVVQYPLLYLGVLRLARVRGRHGSGLAGDSALAALGLATLASAFVVLPLIHTTGGDPAAVITNVVYPLADVHLLGFVVLAWALGGRRLGSVWGVLVGVSALSLVTDAFYLLQIADETYVWGTILDAGWPAVAVGYAAAAFLPAPQGEGDGREHVWLKLAFPAVGSLIGIGVLAHAALSSHPTDEVEVALSTATLLAAIARATHLATVAHRLERRVAVREHELAQAQALAAVGSFRFDTRTGRVEWSDELWRILGRPHGSVDLQQAGVEDFVHADDVERIKAQLSAARSGAGVFETSFRVVRGDGRIRDVTMRGDMRDGILRAAIQDVTDQRRVEESLRQSEARYRHVVENAHDGIWLIDRDHHGVFVNRRMAAMLGRPPEDVLGVSPAAFTDEEGAEQLERAWAAIETGDRRGVHFEVRFRDPQGGDVWALLSMSALEDWSTGGSALMVTDISERKALEERLRRGAEEDALTGLPNRAVFETEVDAAMGRNEALAVALVDLDHFKYVNDSFGHAAGDDLIRHVARVIAEALPADALVARFGGDEFALLLRGVDHDGATALVDWMLQRLRDDRWRDVGRQSASAGIAVAVPGVPMGAGDLLQAADIALYEAKDAGRDRAAVYSGPNGGLTWVDEVRSAIDEERLVLHAQPIVPLHEGGRERAELLVRMVDRSGELLPPAAFIPTAEQFGLIADLDLWVVRRAIELAGAGRAVEVNISGLSLGEPCIPAMVARAVGEGLDPALLTFEITETATVRDLEAAQAFTLALTGLGCGVALDDFGTGYGSLTYLRHMPVTQLKIDMTFVRDVLTQPGDEQMVRTIVSIARTMGLETVAEGVEDLAALELLRGIGVDYAQGYAIARPAPVASLPAHA